MLNSQHNLDEVLAKTANGLMLRKSEILFLLNLEGPDKTAKVFKAARDIRNRVFSEKVFLYGFIYFSTHCKNDCAFCFYRRSNTVSERYRKSSAEVMETADRLTQSGVNLLDLTMGEDPHFEVGHYDELLQITSEVKRRTGLPIMISPGAVPSDILREFSQIGVDWYACYQETHNRELFRKLRLDQDYDERLNLKYCAHDFGLLTEEGLLAGIGETTDDLAHSFEAMRDLSADQVRVMSFVPQNGTPLEKWQIVPRSREMLVIAVMRLIFPDRLIPASLDVDGISGLKQRLNAGANVITSIIPPDLGLMGVSQSTLDIQEGGRTVAGIMPIINECGLAAASTCDYANWVEKQKCRYASPNIIR